MILSHTSLRLHVFHCWILSEFSSVSVSVSRQQTLNLSSVSRFSTSHSMFVLIWHHCVLHLDWQRCVFDASFFGDRGSGKVGGAEWTDVPLWMNGEVCAGKTPPRTKRSLGKRLLPSFKDTRSPTKLLESSSVSQFLINLCSPCPVRCKRPAFQRVPKCRRMECPRVSVLSGSTCGEGTKKTHVKTCGTCCWMRRCWATMVMALAVVVEFVCKRVCLCICTGDHEPWRTEDLSGEYRIRGGLRSDQTS